MQFEADRIKQQAEAGYVQWLREKRLEALGQIRDAVAEVEYLHQNWGFKESHDGVAWSQRCENAIRSFEASRRQAHQVFGTHLDVLKWLQELSELSVKICRIVQIPFQQGQQLPNWDDILKDHEEWMKTFEKTYQQGWVELHALATPLPESEHERWIRSYKNGDGLHSEKE